MLVRRQVPLRVGLRSRALAQHVEGTQSDVRFARAARQSLFDAASDHEFTADDAHGTTHRQAHQGFAGLARELAHPSRRVRFDAGIQLENAAGEHQPPGRGVDEQRFGLAGVRRPIAGGQLFSNQPVGGGVIGNAQQRFGDAHERNAFLIRQSEFLQEGVQKRPLIPPGTRPFHQCHCNRHGAMACPAGEFQRVQQARDRPIFGPFAVIPNRHPKRIQGRRRRGIQIGGHGLILNCEIGVKYR